MGRPWAKRAAVASFAGALTACSLLTDLSGLTGGATPDADGSIADALVDQASDAPPSTSDAKIGDGGVPGDAPSAVDAAPQLVLGGQGYTQTIAVDSSGVYWMTSSRGGLFRADRATGGNQVRLSGDVAYELTLRPDAIYWSNTTVTRLAKDGGPQTDVAAGSYGAVSDYAIDDATLYLADELDDGGIFQVPVTGGTATPVPSVPSEGVGAIAFDATQLFFVAGGEIWSVPKVGGQIVTVSSSPGSAIVLAVDATNVYWADVGTYPVYGDGRIVEVRKDGAPSTQVELATSQANITSFVTDGTYAYWTLDGPMGSASQGAVRKVPLAGGPVVTIASGLDAPRFAVVDETYVYWVLQTVGDIWRAAK